MQKMQETSITIGIPTYNEEGNITTFFKELVNQISQLSNELEIILVDDSEDNTLALLEEIRIVYPDLSIELIHNNKRMGATHAWNTILEKASGEIIVLLDADIEFGEGCIKKLINSITGEIGLCASNTLPKSKNKTRYSSAASVIAYWLRSVRSHGLSQYTTMGRALSLDGKLGKTIKIPNDVIAIDLYLQCLVVQAGRTVTFNDEAIIYFKPPSTKKDFYSQIVRAVRGHAQISEFVNRFKFKMNLSIMIMEFLKTGLQHPRGAFDLISCYLLLPIYYYKNNKNITHLWDIASSTK
jgi:glycosyltransferase involved in cell wall biosynthesis